jgi:2-phosphoglycerate kinase
MMLLFIIICVWFVSLSAQSSSSRSFLFTPKYQSKPQLILVAGCTGTGKSTFGMSIALRQNILKCISTDTIRAVTRRFDQSPAVMRSSYEGSEDPVENWREACNALNTGVDAIVDDARKRGVSLVLEGVHILPSNYLIDRWKSSGGTAVGVLLAISDAEAHRGLIFKRGEMTKRGEEKKMKQFERIRAIQEEMISMAVKNNWLIIEQRLEPDPVDIVADRLDLDEIEDNFAKRDNSELWKQKQRGTPE